MGEPAIFSTKAHIFQIDPDTKKKWLPSSTQAVPVSFYHDSARGLYRVISVELAKILINSTIVPSMVFTKTSQKFGQWSDSKVNAVYGLGFASEVELAKFMEKFQEVKELSREISQSTLSSMGGGESLNNLQISGLTKESTGSGRTSPLVNKPGSPTVSEGSQVLEQLRYENDRLKIALAQSSSNAKMWETELASLRSSNARLTATMQESQTNIDKWTQQLTSYRDENTRLKKHLAELESTNVGGTDQSQRTLLETRDRLFASEQQCDKKQKELLECQARIDSLKQAEVQNTSLNSKIKALDEENARLRREVAGVHDALDHARRTSAGQQRQLCAVQQQLSAKIHEVYEVNDRLAELIQANGKPD